jgi:hypothetical protein
MRVFRFIKKLSIKDDIETKRKGNKIAGRKNRKKMFRALRKSINKMLDDYEKANTK